MKTLELLAQSDVVLQGRVADAKAHLGPDESYVVTDYVIAPTRFIKPKQTVATARPGETTDIVVQRIGGQMTEGGLQFGTATNGYPESESFKVGEDVVVFLQFDSAARVCRLTQGPFGAFRCKAVVFNQ
jgi:hypothetical protein